MIAPTCVRKAWLTLGTLSVPLEDESSGYFCESLDLGYPVVRDVMDDSPDNTGATDRTQFMGPRTVTADIHAIASAGSTLDAVGQLFAPFMVPSARPVLHYVLDRPGTPERVLTLRAAGLSAPIAGAYDRAVQLQWVAADPVVRDPVAKTATSWAGVTGGGGRTYPWLPPRTYPVGGGTPINATLRNAGDTPVKPLLRIYGPITTPVVTFTRASDGRVFRIGFITGFQIPSPYYVEIDTNLHTAFLMFSPQSNQGSRLTSLDWPNLRWPVMPAAPDSLLMTIAGDASGLVTTNITQVQAIWNDGFLT